MGSRRHAPHGLRIFEERVLETSARPEERTPGLAGKADRRDRPGRVRVRTGRHAPDRVEGAEVPGDVRTEAGRVNPRPIDGAAALGRRTVEGRGDRLVGDDGWVVVAD